MLGGAALFGVVVYLFTTILPAPDPLLAPRRAALLSAGAFLLLRDMLDAVALEQVRTGRRADKALAVGGHSLGRADGDRRRVRNFGQL
jgi:hypothetical protein